MYVKRSETCSIEVAQNQPNSNTFYMIFLNFPQSNILADAEGCFLFRVYNGSVFTPILSVFI